MDDPQPLADGAEDSGFAAAGSSVNASGGSFGQPGGGGSDAGRPTVVGDCCDQLCIQVMIAAGVDVANAGGTLQDIDDAMEAFLQQTNACCWPRVVCQGIQSGSWICNAWRFTGFSPTQGGQCGYERDTWRQQTRTCIKTCWSCARLSYTQTRIETRTEITITFASSSSNCQAPPSGGCAGYTLGDASYTGWSPPPPPCP